MKPLRILVPMALVIWAAGYSQASASVGVLNGDFYNGGSPTPTTPCTPNSGLMQGSDGNFYGTTYAGGTNNAGTIYKINTAGVITVLWQFRNCITCAGGDPSEGQNPRAGLLQGSDGNFYGTTQLGGSGSMALGTVFKFCPTCPSGSQMTTLYSFNGGTLDGAQPYAALVQDSEGYLYGTTAGGGLGVDAENGMVFKIGTSVGSPVWQYPFGMAANDGIRPARAGLVLGSDNNLYGTTTGGGASPFHGTVYQITRTGSETVLYSFGTAAADDGASPQGGVVQGCDGNFYGTTMNGGANNFGTVFEVYLNGSSYTNETLYSFDTLPNDEDGEYPTAGLVLGSDGNFYGTTSAGGYTGLESEPPYGTVFELQPDGVDSTIVLLHTFTGDPTIPDEFGDGATPTGGRGLVQGIDGYFYGTTSLGGEYNQGCVFQVKVQLPARVDQIEGISHPSAYAFTACMPTVAGAIYQLQRRSSFAVGNPWANQGSPTIGTGCPYCFPIAVTGPDNSLFYRVQITP